MNFQDLSYKTVTLPHEMEYLGEIKKEEPTAILGDSFIGIICGAPGTGKTSLVNTLLNSEDVWRGKFDNVYFLTPSGIKGIEPNEENFCTQLNFPWVFHKIKEFDSYIEQRQKKLSVESLRTKAELEYELYDDQQKETTKTELLQTFVSPYATKKPDNLYQKPKTDIELLREKTKAQNERKYRVLFVFDDLIGDIESAKKNPDFCRLVFNRRHIARNFEISLLFTTQKYIKFPSDFRTSLTWCIFFQPRQNDWKAIQNDLLSTSVKHLMPEISLHFQKHRYNFITVVLSPKYNLILNLSKIIA